MWTKITTVDEEDKESSMMISEPPDLNDALDKALRNFDDTVPLEFGKFADQENEFDEKPYEKVLSKLTLLDKERYLEILKKIDKVDKMR
jgi:hypothetical protein